MNTTPRQLYNKIGFSLLVFLCLRSFSVFVGSALDLVNAMTWHYNTYGNVTMQDAYNYFDAIIRTSGTGYLIACGAALIVIRVAGGRKLIYKEIWRKGEPMTLRWFALLFGCYIVASLLLDLAIVLQQWLFGLMGMQITDAAAKIPSTDTMFFFVCVCGPITEELLFRGFVLRTLDTRNRLTAILVSAVLYGLYKGTALDMLMFFCLGMLLGYIAERYNVFWAAFIRLLDDLLLRDSLPRLLQGDLYDIVSNVFNLILAIFLTYVLIRHRKKIVDEMWENIPERDTQKIPAKAFFSAPWILIYLVLMLSKIFIAGSFSIK